ncbi:hypothetical protein PoB_006733300 [Plakobranchus ocellatus]|uniref:Secreted protein n=1 Tax=Plakobranchus ocellatus TaxID=259542 RepID=A0AAV4D9A5_9GAST|nr:hypothetical protein PoB_006733300 [Plakobranchus ocellatus]
MVMRAGRWLKLSSRSVFLVMDSARSDETSAMKVNGLGPPRTREVKLGAFTRSAWQSFYWLLRGCINRHQRSHPQRESWCKNNSNASARRCEKRFCSRRRLCCGANGQRTSCNELRRTMSLGMQRHFLYGRSMTKSWLRRR